MPNMLMNPYSEFETAEIKLYRAILEINHRVLLTHGESERSELRATAETLRGELVKLVQSIQIPTELDVQRAHSAQASILPSSRYPGAS